MHWHWQWHSLFFFFLSCCGGGSTAGMQCQITPGTQCKFTCAKHYAVCNTGERDSISIGLCSQEYGSPKEPGRPKRRHCTVADHRQNCRSTPETTHVKRTRVRKCIQVPSTQKHYCAGKFTAQSCSALIAALRSSSQSKALSTRGTTPTFMHVRLQARKHK